MCYARYKAHTDPLFKENKILKNRYIVNLNCLKLYHKYKNKKLPNFFNNMFTTNTDIHSCHTRRKMTFTIFHIILKALVKELDMQFPISLMNWHLVFVKKLSTLKLEKYTNYFKSFIIDSY